MHKNYFQMRHAGASEAAQQGSESHFFAVMEMKALHETVVLMCFISLAFLKQCSLAVAKWMGSIKDFSVTERSLSSSYRDPAHIKVQGLNCEQYCGLWTVWPLISNLKPIRNDIKQISYRINLSWNSYICMVLQFVVSVCLRDLQFYKL